MSEDMKKYLKIMESANTSPQETVEEASSETCDCKKYECEICFPPKNESEEKSSTNESEEQLQSHQEVQEDEDELAETNMKMDKVSDKDYPKPPEHKDDVDRVSDDDYADDKISDKDYPKVKEEEEEVEEKKATFTPPMPDEEDVVDCDDQPDHLDCNWAMDDSEIAKQLYRASPGGKAGVAMVAKKLGKSPEEVMGLLRPKMEDASEGSYVDYVKRMLNR